MPAKLQFAALRLWHAWVAGSFLVAYVTADEDTYAMHLFAGWSVVVALAVRLLLALAPAVRLPRPDWRGTLSWLSSRKGRNPLFAWIGAAVLVLVGISGVTGALADGMPWLEDPHEAASELALWVVLAHVAFIAMIYGGRRLPSRALAVLVVVALPLATLAAEPRQAVLDAYAVQAKAPFSAERGEKLFRTKWAGGDPRTPSCSSCHTDNPRQAGQNAKTGRTIEPVAVSANPKRFTDLDQVEKQFGRDCKSVLGRDCTPLEKGDYITFMAGQ
jgi:mono/diheme cytochrome c family protein